MIDQVIEHIFTQVILLIVFCIAYYLIRRKSVYAITSFLIGLTTFFLIFILSKNEFGIAAGLGLFAIFGIIRYRTESIPIIEMTFLFICITISAIGALTDNILLTFRSSLFINAFLIVAAVILIYWYHRSKIHTMKILVDSVDWLSKSQEEKLQFLSDKCFHRVTDYDLDSIDWLREVCNVTVSYKK
jgi:cellobiose-specific phosphotransferase system component IIC